MSDGGVPSNRISGQMWCIVGARESYATAIEAGSWQGFACSLDALLVKDSVLGALDATKWRLDELDFSEIDDAQLDLAFALHEHEVQHHGQLIRYVYANGLRFLDNSPREPMRLAPRARVAQRSYRCRD